MDEIKLPKFKKEDFDKLNETFIEDRRVGALFLSEEDFQGLANPLYDMNKKDKEKENLLGIYRTIIDILKRYCDIEEKYYSLIALWIIGTYYHNEFPTFPYLFFNAMKGSGKSRLLRLICYLSKDGSMLNSLTEATMFRTTGMLGIDEFEGLNRKGKENLTELLNSAYKKGASVKRFKKVKTFAGEEQQVEEFNVYRAIALANISGMDSVLSDRCFTIYLNKSSNPAIINRVENFERERDIKEIKASLNVINVVCVDVVSIIEHYNHYIDMKYNYTNYTNNTNNTTTYTTYNTYNTQTTQTTFFDKLVESKIGGRHLELSLPLLILASSLNEEVLDDLIKTLVEMVNEKKKDDAVENLDVMLLDFLSQEPESENWVSIKDLLQNFQNSVRMNDDWLTEKWLGRALKRLCLIKDKKRVTQGIYVRLDYQKAQEKIRMFR